MFTQAFLLDALERALKTTAQVAAAAFAANEMALWVPVELTEILKLAVASGIISVLTSIASAGVGDSDSASLVNKSDKQ